ncbi:hypothetical protein ACF0H5_010612 [Mactra antiquata]
MRRKIELGWLNQVGSTLKQVRSPNGGGTRTLDIEMSCMIQDILTTAKELFFPDGMSKKGSVDAFVFHMADQTQIPLDGTTIFKELCENTKLKHLRLYMVTSPKLLSVHETFTTTVIDNMDHQTSQQEDFTCEVDKSSKDNECINDFSYQDNELLASENNTLLGTYHST